MGLRSETVVSAVQSGDADRVNDTLDAVRDAGTVEKARLFADCFEDCRALYEDADDGYVRQSVVRLLASADPRLGAVGARGDDPDEIELADDGDDYRDELVEVYLTALQDDDGRVRNAAKRELTPLAIRFEMHGENARLDALHERLDELADEVSDEKRDHVVDAREQVGASARPGGRGLGSVFDRFGDEMRESDD